MKTISSKNKFKKSQTQPRDPRQDPRRPTSTRLKPPVKRKPSKKK